MRIINLFLSTLFTYFLTSSAFAFNMVIANTIHYYPNTTIPTMYTCDGKGVSPGVDWIDPPNKTQSFVLILSDPDAPYGTMYHWIVYNIPADVKALYINHQVPSGAMTGNNSWNNASYQAICPPQGTHHYVFTLYALDSKLNIPANANINTVQDALKTHVLGQTHVTETYTRSSRN